MEPKFTMNQKFSMAEAEQFAHAVAALGDAQVVKIDKDTAPFVVEHQLEHYFVTLKSNSKKPISPHMMYRRSKDTELSRFMGRGNDMHVRSADGGYTMHLGFEKATTVVLTLSFFPAF